MNPSKRHRILAICDEWHSSKGGLSTFNRELCLALAKCGQDVCCVVVAATPEEQEEALNGDVHLLIAPPLPGGGDRDALFLAAAALKKEWTPEAIIGHGRITGPHAHVVRRTSFSGALLVHFLHMDATSIAPHKQPTSPGLQTTEVADDREQDEIALARRADIRVGVGPRLHQRLADHLGVRADDVLEFLPGISDCERPSPPLRRTCLVIGRAEDLRLKGLDIAAGALRRLRAEGDRQVEFHIVGAPRGTTDRLLDDLADIVGDRSQLVVRPFAPADRVARLFQAAAVVLMPSRSEGFGLVGLEALSFGRPILISEQSGLADALRRHASDAAERWIVDASGDDQDEVAARWAQRIAKLLTDPEGEFDAIWELRERLHQTFSWTIAAQRLVERISAPPERGGGDGTDELPPGSAPAPPFQDTRALAAAHPASSAFARVSEALLSWPHSLPRGTWLPRPELDVVLERIQSQGHTTTVVLGGPGSGKSALFARLASELQARAVLILGIRSDLLPRTVETQEAFSHWLGLESRPSDAVRALASLSPVVVLIDQLDALCNILDASTQRLSVLLQFVEEIGGASNVHIVLSCRQFEFAHDARLRRLKADELQLSPPGRADVVAALLAEGYAADQWDAQFLEMLRIPQHLRLFFEMGNSTERRAPFRTYQAMLEALWNERLASESDAKVALLDRISTDMAVQEELTIPSATYDSARQVLNALAADGFVRIDGPRVSFSHQTLYEFARARAFVRDHASLAKYVIGQQQTLFIRSSLWSTLAYLRECSDKRYIAELTGLWEHAELRLHIRTLLIDFVGQVANPLASEVSLLTGCLRDSGRRGAAMSAIRLNAGVWFPLVPAEELEHLMTSDSRWQVASILRSAVAFHREAVLDLMERHWLEVPDYLPLINQVLIGLKDWNRRAATLVAHATKDSGGQLLDFSVMFSQIQTHAPELAIDLLRDRLVSVLGDAQSRKPDNESAWDAVRRYESVLQYASHFTSLSSLAKTHPDEVRDALFPVYQALASELAAVGQPGGVTYRDDGSLELEFEGRGHFSELPVVLRSACRTTAQTDPERFEEFVRRVQDSDLLAVHRLLASALTELAEVSPQFVLEYLLSDPRRLLIGTRAMPEQYSRALIRAVSIHLAGEAVRRLESAIRGSRLYPESREEVPDPVRRRACLRANREHRLRLFSEMPGDVSSPETAKLVREEREQLHDYDTPHYVITSGTIGSPVSAAQMQRATDDDIINLFELLHDGTEWNHPKRDMEGGSVQAAREFGALAALDPNRAKTLIGRLRPDRQERPVGEALRALAKSDAGCGIVEALVHECWNRGFRSPEFKQSAAWALSDAAKGGLSEETCSLLETWLQSDDEADKSEGDESDDGTPTESTRDAKDEPVIWGWGTSGALPWGNYPTLHAIFLGLMARTPPAVSPWLASLWRHLGRTESKEVWRAMARHLRFVGRGDARESSEFLDALFERFPRVLGSIEGARLVATTHSWAPAEKFQHWLEMIHTGNWGWRHRAYGELLMLKAVRDGSGWADKKVVAAIEKAGDTEMLAGVARSASELWDGRRERGYCAEILSLLVPKADRRIGRVLMDIFGGPRKLVVDDATVRIAREISRRPDLLLLPSHFLFERLQDFLPAHAEVAIEILDAFLTALEKTGQNLYQAGYGASVDELVNLVVTVQRLDRHRQKGLDLFERLLSQDIDAVGRVLVELDARPIRHGASI